MRRTIVEFQDAGVEADIWKIEGIDTQEDCEMIAADRPPRRPRRRGLRGARPRRRRRQGRPLAAPGRRRSRATRASRSAARSGGTRSRASSTGASSARTRPQQIADNYLRFVQVYDEAAKQAAPREPSRGRQAPLEARRGVGSLPGAMRMRQSLAQFEEAFREEAAESVVRRERLRSRPLSARACAASSAARKPGKLRFIAARAVDRRHRRGRHDRDVRDAGRCSPARAAGSGRSAGRAPRRPARLAVLGRVASCWISR